MNETGEHEPTDLPDRSARVSSLSRLESVAIVGIFVLSVCFALYFAKEILMPITAATILAILLQPAVRGLRRVMIPEPLGAGVVVVALLSVLTVGIYFLADPAATWVSQMPDVVAEVQEKLKGPIEEIKDVKQEVESIVEETNEATKVPADPAPRQGVHTEPAAPQPAPQATRVTLLEVFAQTLAIMRNVGWSVVIISVLLFFLLAIGPMFREKLILALPTRRDKKMALEITRDIERDMSAYLATVTLINIGLGVAIGFATHGMGLPNPALWGVMAAVLNFIPYIGAIAGSVVVTIVALVTYDAPIQALLAPLIYIGINAIEANVATPIILGRRLTINPIAVFLSVIFWGWIWGVPGALMAVPILTCAKVICDATERLAPLSQFLSGRRSP